MHDTTGPRPRTKQKIDFIFQVTMTLSVGAQKVGVGEDSKERERGGTWKKKALPRTTKRKSHRVTMAPSVRAQKVGVGEDSKEGERVDMVHLQFLICSRCASHRCEGVLYSGRLGCYIADVTRNTCYKTERRLRML